ncbi:hypothetical protein B566_EDAN015966 [Ephemera danica]|nr:hypothetical protein B566_EDAN015966 [Ephemera danica]
MRRARSTFRPQVNIPKVKKPKKEEATENTASTGTTVPTGGHQCSQTSDTTTVTEVACSSSTKDGSNTAEQSTTVEKEVIPCSPVKPVHPVATRASPLPPTDSSSSEDEGVIDPYDPNNPQGTRIERERGIFRKSQRFQKTFANGKPTSMIDYLFYNPKGTPMIHSLAEKVTTPSCRDEDEVRDEEGMEDEPEVVAEPEQLPAPKFAPTVLETTEAREGREKLIRSSTTGSVNLAFPKRGCAARIKWTNQETIFFYKCLATLGTDFEMISKYFPGRTRHHIKLKYKLEEKTNPLLITKAFTGGNFDVTELQHEYQLVAQKAKEERQRKKTSTRGPAKGHKRKRKCSEDEEDKGSTTSSGGDTDIEEELRAEMEEADRKPRKEELHILHIKREAKQMRDSKQSAPVITQHVTTQHPQIIPASHVQELQQTESSRNPVIRQILSTGVLNKPVLNTPTNLAAQSPGNNLLNNMETICIPTETLKEQLVQLMRVDGKALATLKGQSLPGKLGPSIDSLSVVPNEKLELNKGNLSSEPSPVPTDSLVTIKESPSKDQPSFKTPENPGNESEVSESVVGEEVIVDVASADECELDSDDSGQNSDDSEKMEIEFLSKSPQPTRFGRVPKHKPTTEELPVKTTQAAVKTRQMDPNIRNRIKKPRKKKRFVAPEIRPTLNLNPPSPASSETSSIADGREVIALPPDVDPGSLLVLKTSDPSNPDKVLYKVYMISPNCGGTTVIHNPDGSVQAVSASYVNAAEPSTDMAQNATIAIPSVSSMSTPLAPSTEDKQKLHTTELQ